MAFVLQVLAFLVIALTTIGVVFVLSMLILWAGGGYGPVTQHRTKKK